MNMDIIMVAIISLVGTLAGTFGGIITSSNLVSYRIEQLEKKVEKHNNLIDRTYKLENRCNIIEQEIGDIREDVHSLVSKVGG